MNKNGVTGEHMLRHDVVNYYRFLRVAKQRLKASLEEVTGEIKRLERNYKIKKGD